MVTEDTACHTSFTTHHDAEPITRDCNNDHGFVHEVVNFCESEDGVPSAQDVSGVENFVQEEEEFLSKKIEERYANERICSMQEVEEAEKETFQKVEDDVEEEYGSHLEFQSDPSCSTHKKSSLRDLQCQEEDADFARLGVHNVDLGYVIQQLILNVYRRNRHKNGCKKGDWRLLDNYKTGNRTIVYMQCEECHEVFSLSTHPTDPNAVDINYKFVAGCMSVGIGY